MAYVTHTAAFHAAMPCRPAPNPLPRRRGFWRTIFDAVMLAHQRDTQREIARYMAGRRKLTDSMEREIAERLMGRWKF